MKKLFHVALALMLCVSAAFAQDDLEKRVDGLQAQVNRALSKAGIHFSGEFRSQFLNSQVSGGAVDEANKRSESAEFTSVDFDVVARPNNVLSARAVFRLHQDWRNFFSDVQNPIVTRWLSIDGQVGGMLEYHAGDYLKKLSPLTLWNHEFELLYEPEIFAADRRFAMSEAFVGDSKRLMQGFDIALKAELYPLLKEISFDAFGARLATRGTKESAVVVNEATFDKYLLGVNIGSQIIDGAGVALSDIYIYDHLASYQGTEEAAKGEKPQGTNVFAGRLNADTRIFMDDDMILAGINAEVAYSSDQRWYMENGATTYSDSAITGIALNAGLSFRLALDEANRIKLTADYVMNDKTFRNDAAQTPHFMQRQIMNSENALGGLGLQNPFDAMYRSVFKYVPSQYFAGAQPQTKNAYNNVILSPEAIGAYNGSDVKLPSVFQAAGNKATADRVGPIVALDGTFLDKALTVGARLTMFKNIEDGTYVVPDEFGGPTDETVTVPANEYLTAGGGASIDVAKFVPVLGPSLKIGGSFMMYNNTYNELYGRSVAKTENNSQLISAELNYNFVSRFSFLAGYQLLTTNIAPEGGIDTDYTFDNLGVGFGYKVADGGSLTIKFTRVSGERAEYNIVSSNPGYDPDDPSTGTQFINTTVPKLSYRAIQPEVYLTVKF